MITAWLGRSEESDWLVQVKINTSDGMANMLNTLNSLDVSSRVELSGTLVVARDIAHAKLQERLDAGEEMPQYMRDYPVCGLNLVNAFDRPW